MKRLLSRFDQNQVDEICAFLMGANSVLQLMPNPSGNDPMRITGERNAATGKVSIYLQFGRWVGSYEAEFTD